MDNELFELCKEVHERLRWEIEDASWFVQGLDDKKPWLNDRAATVHGYRNLAPLYTSDYLLDKLPRDIVTEDDHTYLCLNVSMSNQWAVGYRDAAGNKGTEVLRSDTPLKALLKLTIELHKQGLLEK